MNQKKKIVIVINIKPKNPYFSNKSALLGCILALITVYDAVRCDKQKLPWACVTIIGKSNETRNDST